MSNNKPFILKQLAIAMTKNGEIGLDDDLLFTSERDLHNFAVFTNNTALIMGRNTANQMIRMGVLPTPFRPWVVLTSNLNHVTHPAGEAPWKKYVAYADTFAEAGRVSRGIVEDSGSLFGITVVGGLQVYEEAIELLRKTKTSFNHVYIHTNYDTVAGANKQLSVDFGGLYKLMQAQMSAPNQIVREMAVETTPVGMPSQISSTAAYRWMYDADEYNPSRIVTLGGRGSKVRIQTGDNTYFTLDLKEVAMYEMTNSADRMTVTMKSGVKQDIRMDVGRPGLRHLEVTINRYWSTAE